MKDSGTFLRSLLPADANNIVTIVDFNQILSPYKEFEIDYIVSHAIVLEDFQVKCGLFSLLEADWPKTNALASESLTEAEQARIKKEGQKIYLDIFHAYGNGPWIPKAEEILQNKNSLEQAWALMAPAFSTNETALIDEDLKIGVRVSSKAQGVGGLKGNDYLRIFGSWRKVTNFRKKKDDNEALADRISALESLLAVFGAPSASLPGTNGLVPAPPAGSAEFLLRGDRSWENPSKFATPDQINAAIIALIGGAPEPLNTLGELVANFANYVTLAQAHNINGLIRFANTEDAINLVTGTRFDGGVAVAKNLVLGGKLTRITAYTFRAATSVSQAITNATFTKVVFNTELNDSNNQYNLSLSRLTAITAETWRISVLVTFNLSVASRVILSIFKNNVEANGIRLFDIIVNAGLFAQLMTVELTLAVGDYLEVFGYIQPPAGSPNQSVFGEGSFVSTFWYGTRIN